MRIVVEERWGFGKEIDRLIMLCFGLERGVAEQCFGKMANITVIDNFLER